MANVLLIIPSAVTISSYPKRVKTLPSTRAVIREGALLLWQRKLNRNRENMLSKEQWIIIDIMPSQSHCRRKRIFLTAYAGDWLKDRIEENFLHLYYFAAGKLC